MEKFKFLVDCNNKESCEIVRKHMKENGFKYIRLIEGRLTGDHSGIKEFPSLKAARKEFLALHKKYVKEIHQIIVL